MENKTSSKPHIIVETLNHRKVDLIREAGADQVVCNRDFGIGVLVQSIFYHDVAKVFSEILSYSRGSEFYILEAPEHCDPQDSTSQKENEFIGKTFPEVSKYFAENQDPNNPIIPLGVLRKGPKGRDLYLNPSKDFRIQQGDLLLVMAWKRPTLSPKPGHQKNPEK